MEPLHYKHKIVIFGFGSIATGLLPLLFRSFHNPHIVVITSDDRNIDIARHYKVEHIIQPITKNNYQSLLQKHLQQGDFLVNLSVDVSSVALLEWCHDAGVLYIDTCIEPWAGYYTDDSLSTSARSNYALRDQALSKRAAWQQKGGKNNPTALIAHGANPGLVNHFVKQALLNIAADTGHKTETPRHKQQWVELAAALGIKVIHIAERDTQYAAKPKKRGEFINTWSIDGFYSEGMQPSELGWGSHEKHFPSDGNRHDFGCGAAIYLSQPGCITRARSWTPDEGPYQGWIITHNESISIADYFSGKVAGKDYRPTVHYTYHPCDGAVLSLHELAGHNFHLQPEQRLIVDEIVDGIDELGVLLMGHKKTSYWYGSNLSIKQTRDLVPHNSATTLQVTAPVLAGMIWAINNPNEGILDADELPFDQILAICTP
ncbi:MAG: saccharopine dehydrogenase NADP-binding domain-containing protein, partial [Alphaproteobacteria bacterium]|nr:saccharopine dehydrogenase NADP-binding domain-containing protein [Alphaproteobacteria bacterium]